MGLSSNSIIHFTNKFSSLIGILENNFTVRYCQENIVTKEKNFNILIPMVSFCDIPFSQIIDHINKYGSYGIGLKKEWAEKNGLNPVLYTEKLSNLSGNISKLYVQLTKTKKSISDLSLNEKESLDFLRYIKNYQSDLKRTGRKTIPNYRFSDEREWRFTPSIESKNLLFGNLKRFEEDDYKRAKELLNKKNKFESLDFEPDDVTYIIIKKEDERNRLINKIESTKSKYSLEQVKRLTSRIISVEQLKSDF